MSAGFTKGQRRFSTPCKGRETWATWLGEEPEDPHQLKALLAPYPSEGMTCWPVSTRVGGVKNNDARLNRADLGAMSHIWLAAVFVLLALTGCAQETVGQKSPPYALPSRDSGADIRGM
jgi:hypothetical protein